PLPPAQPTPRPPLPPAATASAGTHAPPEGESVGAETLWRAFCEGSGAHFDPPQGLNPELMRVIGSLLRASVEGMVQLMAIRAATKHELRAEMTMIQARNNNPLKFSPDAQAALEQLLQPPMRGFMAGPAAVHDAMNDLVGHTIGTMAGMRAALEGVLQRFQPSVLEGKLVGSSVLDTLLPMNRRARLWELYLQHFESIRGEAQEDFHTLFGKAFVAAYEQQLDRLYEQQHAQAREAAAAAASSRRPAAGPGAGSTHRG
ncbi:MAG TPA: type VI secretion system-associated FHA domain protein TagH, partial [Burkholderiaceae bacterium]|nr:type VI secretion system-associated FHA domain protein TagH [Burkholderiaceae bacterium]